MPDNHKTALPSAPMTTSEVHQSSSPSNADSWLTRFPELTYAELFAAVRNSDSFELHLGDIKGNLTVAAIALVNTTSFAGTPKDIFDIFPQSLLRVCLRNDEYFVEKIAPPNSGNPVTRRILIHIFRCIALFGPTMDGQNQETNDLLYFRSDCLVTPSFIQRLIVAHKDSTKIQRGVMLARKWRTREDSSMLSEYVELLEQADQLIREAQMWIRGIDAHSPKAKEAINSHSRTLRRRRGYVNEMIVDI